MKDVLTLHELGLFEIKPCLSLLLREIKVKKKTYGMTKIATLKRQGETKR